MILGKSLKNMLVYPNAKVDKIIKLIQISGFNGVFVVTKTNIVLGLITDADIRKLFLKKKYSKRLKASDIMNKNFLSIGEQPTEVDYFKILINSEKVIIPILKNKKIVNFIHVNDLKFKKEIIKKKFLIFM